MDKVVTAEPFCHFCGSKIYRLLRCSWCLHTGCLSCLANDNRVCVNCVKIKAATTQMSFTGCLSGLANDDCQCDNCIKRTSENIKKALINCHFCNDEILVPYPLTCKTCNYIGCMKCLNDDCKCSNCVKFVEKSPRSAICFSCDTYKEVNNEGFCDECIHQTALYHSNDAQIKADYTRSELEFIKSSNNKQVSPINNSNHNPINNSNHDPITNSDYIMISPTMPRKPKQNKNEILRLQYLNGELADDRPDHVVREDEKSTSWRQRIDRTANVAFALKQKREDDKTEEHSKVAKQIDIPTVEGSRVDNLKLFNETVRDVDRLVGQLYPNLKGEGPCRECGERSTRKIVFQTALPDPYFLCMSCARCSRCGEKNKGRCWMWPANKEFICGHCVCRICLEWDGPWDESVEKEVDTYAMMAIYRQKTEKDEYDLICKVRDILSKRVYDQEQTQQITQQKETIPQEQTPLEMVTL